jgi:hypothetical protein
MQASCPQIPSIDPFVRDGSEEQAMTFQVALVGCDGLVIASDRLSRHMRQREDGTEGPSQMISERKYFTSADRKWVCFAAGDRTAISLAQEIAANPQRVPSLNETEAEWRRSLLEIVRDLPASSSARPSELLISHGDWCDCFWHVAVDPRNVRSFTRMNQHYCTGTPALASFILRHLWKPTLTTAEMQKLALLTLSYAAQEEPGSVREPFDVMTLRAGEEMQLSEHGLSNASFQHGLEALFASVSREQ